MGQAWDQEELPVPAPRRFGQESLKNNKTTELERMFISPLQADAIMVF